MLLKSQNQSYTALSQWEAFLAPTHITAETWDLSHLDEAMARESTQDKALQPQVLEQIRIPLEAAKSKYGYKTEDIICLSPETPGLEELLAKFDKEHHHTDDEVRLILAGHGIFGIVPLNGPAFELHVEKGDYISIPAYTRHWFTLSEDTYIVTVRIFKNQAGWVAIYDPLATKESVPVGTV